MYKFWKLNLVVHKVTLGFEGLNVYLAGVCYIYRIP